MKIMTIPEQVAQISDILEMAASFEFLKKYCDRKNSKEGQLCIRKQWKALQGQV